MAPRVIPRRSVQLASHMVSGKTGSSRRGSDLSGSG